MRAVGDVEGMQFVIRVGRVHSSVSGSIRDRANMGPCGGRLPGWLPVARTGESGNPHCLACIVAASRIRGCPSVAAGPVDIAIGCTTLNTTRPLGFDPGARHRPPGITAPAFSAYAPGQPSSSFAPWHFTRWSSLLSQGVRRNHTPHTQLHGAIIYLTIPTNVYGQVIVVIPADDFVQTKCVAVPVVFSAAGSSLSTAIGDSFTLMSSNTRDMTHGVTSSATSNPHDRSLLPLSGILTTIARRAPGPPLRRCLSRPPRPAYICGV